MNKPAECLPEYFQQLYQQDADPWQVRKRWYEQRKRALVLAALPQQFYRNAYEPACGNGELTLALAPRCEQLLAADLSEAALRLTRNRLQLGVQFDHVRLERQVLPDDWPRRPDQPFDLILISELAYYLNHVELALLIAHSVATLAPAGTLLLCHWRPDFEQRILSTERVHAAFGSVPVLQQLLRHEEDDFLLEVWSRNGQSVAQREGVR